MIAKKLAQNLSQEQAAFATLVANYNGYKWVPPPTATPTLTQSGLLAVLLQQQRYKVIQLARRRVRRDRMRATLWHTLTWLLARGPRRRRLLTIPPRLRGSRSAAHLNFSPSQLPCLTKSTPTQS